MPMKPPRPSGSNDSDGRDEFATGDLGAQIGPPDRHFEAANKRLGTVLRGKYRLDAVLGIGGMSVVYRAMHRNQAEFAIKMLLPEHAANDELRSRFLREGYA